MKKNSPINAAFALLLSLAGGFAAAGMSLQAAAQTATAPEANKTVSPEVGTPVQEAQKLLQEKKFAEAQAKLDGITKNPLAPYESYVIDRTRLAIASTAGDEKLVMTILPRVVDSSEVPADEKLRLLFSGAAMSDKQKDYKQALVWTQRYIKEGGNDPRARDELVSDYYLTGDYANAGKELKVNMDAEEKAGKVPTEIQFKLLISVASQEKDNAALNAALEKRLTYYPTKENWAPLLQTWRNRKDVPERLAVDFYRLKYQMGILEAKEYAYFVDSELHIGYATEAKKILDAGYASKAIGDDTPDIKALMAQATKDAANESRSIAQTEAEVRKNKDGLGLVNVGYSYITLGQFDKGLEMMEQGVKASNAKRLDEAKLHLGEAYVQAGQKEKAIDVLKTVQGSDGTADLARYWILNLNNPMH